MSSKLDKSHRHRAAAGPPPDLIERRNLAGAVIMTVAGLNSRYCRTKWGDKSKGKCLAKLWGKCGAKVLGKSLGKSRSNLWAKSRAKW
uniref:Uncharacterized protein n=1 Tax=Romanomermis culicivorax TaxID=13658 RepID=A0A915HW71_ROMCU